MTEGRVLVAYSAAMHPSTGSIRWLGIALLGAGTALVLSACGGDDDDSGNPNTNGNTTQSGTGGSHAAGSGSGGSSTNAGAPMSGGSGGSSAIHGGGSSGSGGSTGSNDAGVADSGTEHDAGSTCFSPTQHLDTAYEQGSVGCPCEDGDPSQCIQGVALICDGTHWTAVEDGPCEPGPESMRVAYSSKECTSLGGLVVSDPGDGSLFRNGCPGGKDALGIIDNSQEPASGIPIEGALCCACAAKGGDCSTQPVACGARAGDTCEASMFCAYLPGALCGAADAEAICRTRPTDCTDLPQKVCGCDGKDYDNACKANEAGTGIDNLGACH